jgi:hypothetical protein
MKIKLFSCSDQEKFEQLINEWLADNPNIQITHFTQSFDGDILLISILYRE